MASSTAVRTAEDTRVKLPSLCPSSVRVTDSHSLQGRHWGLAAIQKIFCWATQGWRRNPGYDLRNVATMPGCDTSASLRLFGVSLMGDYMQPTKACPEAGQLFLCLKQGAPHHRAKI